VPRNHNAPVQHAGHPAVFVWWWWWWCVEGGAFAPCAACTMRCLHHALLPPCAARLPHHARVPAHPCVRVPVPWQGATARTATAASCHPWAPRCDPAALQQALPCPSRLPAASPHPTATGLSASPGSAQQAATPQLQQPHPTPRGARLCCRRPTRRPCTTRRRSVSCPPCWPRMTCATTTGDPPPPRARRCPPPPTPHPTRPH
jgi:hypothetical protein